MIYLDNAATTLRKPPQVEQAMVDALLEDLEKISRHAHEQTGFTYTSLEEIAVLN